MLFCDACVFVGILLFGSRSDNEQRSGSVRSQQRAQLGSLCVHVHTMPAWLVQTRNRLFDTYGDFNSPHLYSKPNTAALVFGLSF